MGNNDQQIHSTAHLPVLELQDLVHLIMRIFYEPRHIILMDLLTQAPMLRDDVLSIRSRIPVKEVNRILARLRQDKLLCVESKTETEKSSWIGSFGGRTISRYYYYIDYGQFVNVVKLKLAKIRQKLENSHQIQEALYRCNSCSGTWTLLETPLVFDPFTSLFICPNCNLELENAINTNVSTMTHGRSNSTYSEFMEIQTSIISLLKKADEVTISSIDVNRLLQSTLVSSNEETSANTTDLVSITGNGISSSVLVDSKKEETLSGIEVDLVPSSHVSKKIKSMTVLDTRLISLIQNNNNSDQPHQVHYPHQENKDDDFEKKVDDERLVPFVEVQGAKILIDELTEDDLSKMSPEEYEAYYLAFQNL